jgi:hypothetical protein
MAAARIASNIGGKQIDAAVTAAFLAAVEPAGLDATVAAVERERLRGRPEAVAPRRRVCQLRRATRPPPPSP